AMNEPLTAGAPSTLQSMSASRYARPLQLAVCGGLGPSAISPGVAASTAAQSTTLVEFQKPTIDPLMSFSPGTYTLFRSPKQLTLVLSVFCDIFHLLTSPPRTGRIPAGSY